MTKLIQLPDADNIWTDLRIEYIKSKMSYSAPGDKIPGIYEQLVFYSGVLTISSPGIYIVQGTLVPDGYIHHVQGAWMSYSGTITGKYFAFGVRTGSTFTGMWLAGLDATLKTANWTGNLYVLPAYRPAFYIYSGEATKTCELSYVGVTMRIPETPW